MGREEVPGIEAEIGAGQAIEAAQQQGRADEQDHAQCGFRDDER